MNIISIDLPWSPVTKGRRTLAIADLERNVSIRRAGDDSEMLALVGERAETGSVILLDIPIEGVDKLVGGHFRPVDKAIAHQGLPVLPSSKAGNRGKELKIRLEMSEKKLEVYEIYPYAVYKFLAYLKSKSQLDRLNSQRFESLLDDDFPACWPPKYKREREKSQNLENMKYLYSLLTDPAIGLNFETPLHYPSPTSQPGPLSDEYDACLGAIVGLYLAEHSPYVWVAGDDSGSILLLADKWLVERLRREVPVYQS